MRRDISLKTKARLAARAQEQGISIDAFLERLLSLERHLNEAGDPAAKAASGKAPELPVRYLGVIGSLHRRDIYDDVR